MVVVQLIHRLTQADISCTTTPRLFFFPLLVNNLLSSSSDRRRRPERAERGGLQDDAALRRPTPYAVRHHGKNLRQAEHCARRHQGQFIPLPNFFPTSIIYTGRPGHGGLRLDFIDFHSRVKPVCPCLPCHRFPTFTCPSRIWQTGTNQIKVNKCSVKLHMILPQLHAFMASVGKVPDNWPYHGCDALYSTSCHTQLVSNPVLSPCT